ncbi:CRISPR-associated protein Cas4 [Synergistales bacterium]|nr:CRISPR-associated protein Cas4 [Synergistales bacterium]
MLTEDDYLLLSGIQHFSFCRRQWALIHIEQAWSENLRTVEGKLMHERAHDPFFTEKRGDTIIAREMPVFSNTLGVSGQCDVVEFHSDKNGVTLHGRTGLWLPCPIEYKRGSPKVSDADRLQLCAQAICLEEMLLCSAIKTAYLYYGETHRREAVDLTAELRETVRSCFAEMRGYFERRYTPRVKPTKSCNACSLKDICLPKMPKNSGVREYINGVIGESE